jgi:hypothetical protein
MDNLELRIVNRLGGTHMSLALVAALTGVCFAGAIAAVTIGLGGR